MFALPPVTFGRIESNLPATPNASNIGTLITAAGSTHTKGAYSSGQLIAATTDDTYGVWLTWGRSFTSATLTNQLLDIGIGASGSEETIISNLQTGWADVGNSLWLPLFIPGGTRIAARIQGQIASDTLALGIFLHQAPSAPPWPVFTVCDAYGADTAGTGGLTHTAGTSGAESTWTNIGSTLSRNYGGMFPMIQGNADTTLSANGFHVELGVNSTTYAEWLYLASSSEVWQGPHPGTAHYCDLPSGTQLMIRAECGATPEAMECVAYCLA